MKIGMFLEKLDSGARNAQLCMSGRRFGGPKPSVRRARG
jgi:hypothetical protein